jgi:hypothetical protein
MLCFGGVGQSVGGIADNVMVDDATSALWLRRRV